MQPCIFPELFLVPQDSYKSFCIVSTAESEVETNAAQQMLASTPKQKLQVLEEIFLKDTEM